MKLRAVIFLIEIKSYHIGVPQRLTDRQANVVEFDFSISFCWGGLSKPFSVRDNKVIM